MSRRAAIYGLEVDIPVREAHVQRLSEPQDGSRKHFVGVEVIPFYPGWSCLALLGKSKVPWSSHSSLGS